MYKRQGKQAGVGESKKFKVIIEINETDLYLRPLMTTSNKILIKKFKNVVYIPQEAVFNNDTSNFAIVKKSNSLYKKKLKLGSINSDYVIINEGLKEGETILLSKPENDDEISWINVTNEE